MSLNIFFIYQIYKRDSNQAFNPVDLSAGNMNLPGSQSPIDFSAIGKGLCSRQNCEVLASNGIFNYFIDIGGEISINGTKFGEFLDLGRK